MDQLARLMEKMSEEIGVRILASSRDFQRGFEGIRCRISERFYGVKPSLDYETIGCISFEDAISKGYFADMEISLAKRCFRIAQDTVSRSESEGISCYNGIVAKLMGLKKIRGSTTISDILELDFCKTSYFTALGTNISFRGYKYANVPHPDEPELPPSLDWVKNQTISLSDSPLANQLGVHLILYNEDEILYVRRSKRVGESTDLFNSPVNGVVEFAEKESDVDQDGNPDVYKTATREATFELGLTIARDRIKWLALAVAKDTLEPFLIGKCKIDKSGREVRREMIEAKEGFEVADKRRKEVREKDVCWIPTRNKVEKEDLSLPFVGTFSILKPVVRPSVEEIVREKIRNQRELWTFPEITSDFSFSLGRLSPNTEVVFGRFPSGPLRSLGYKQVEGQWHHSGAMALLYALPTIYTQEALVSALAHALERP